MASSAKSFRAKSAGKTMYCWQPNVHAGASQLWGESVAMIPGKDR